MTERHAVIKRLFLRAAMRVGSAGALAQQLQITYSELRLYLEGEAAPPEEVLLKAVSVILDELPAIRTEFSRETWDSLRLPG